MRIESLEEQPLVEIPFLNAGKGPGSFTVERLPVQAGTVSGLPDGLDALIATADLQGRERFQDSDGGPPRLLGEVLPGRLAEELLPDLGIAPERTGVILAGDFYTVPNLDERGGFGDVVPVWQAFADPFRWVAGVAGNHDGYGDAVAPSRRIARNAEYLDGESVTLDDLKIAGIGGIVGHPRRPHRKSEDDYLALLDLLLKDRPHLLILHDGPDVPEHGFRGSASIRMAMEQLPPTLLIRGHSHWPVPLAELPNGTQVLNVDCRVVILRRCGV